MDISNFRSASWVKLNPSLCDFPVQYWTPCRYDFLITLILSEQLAQSLVSNITKSGSQVSSGLLSLSLPNVVMRLGLGCFGQLCFSAGQDVLWVLFLGCGCVMWMWVIFKDEVPTYTPCHPHVYMCSYYMQPHITFCYKLSITQVAGIYTVGLWCGFKCLMC